MPGELFKEPSAPPCPTTTGDASQYTFVSVDIDTTGKRLIDEIIQLSAYTPQKQYNQYIMPYMNLNQNAKMKHQVRVINLGIFRMLKNMTTHKVIKTKIEYEALKEFLDWLEEVKNEAHQQAEEATPLGATSSNWKGVVLVFHEQRQFIPCMLLGAFKRYDMMDRFSSLIVGFGNNYWLAERKCCQPFKYLSLTQLAKMFLNLTDEQEKGLFEGNASVRAKLAYDIFQHLLSQPVSDANGNEIESILDKMDLMNVGSGTASSAASDDGHDGPMPHHGTTKVEELKKLRAASAIVAGHTPATGVIMNVEQSLSVLSVQQDVIKRQNSLRPLFVNYFRGKMYQRLLAVDCRRVLAEAGFDMDKLQEVWDEKKTEGLTELIENLDLGEKKEELIKILDAHFDPEKSPMKPTRNPNHSRRGSDFRPRSKNFRMGDGGLNTSTGGLPPTGLEVK